jgi:hypothetical protein
MRGGVAVLPVAIAVALAGCALAGCGTASGTAVAGGYYDYGDTLMIKNMTVDGGRYTIGYSFEARLDSSVINGRMGCQLVDSSGGLSEVQRTVSEVQADGMWAKLEFFGQYSIADATLGIRCTPDVPGTYAMTVRALNLYAKPIDD